MAVIITVPGIWSRGHGSTDLLTEPLTLRGHEVHPIDQKIRSPWDVRSKKKVERDAMEIVELAYAVNATAIIGHSYGCLKSAIASRYWFFKDMWLFRPAMSRNYKFPTCDTNITCVHSKGDFAILLGGMLIAHKFGLAGRKGFKDERVNNIKTTGGHNADFDGDIRWMWAQRIHNDLTV